MSIQFGDHVKVMRIGYSHHGLYVGDGKVIHYNGDPMNLEGTVELTTLEGFGSGGKVDVVFHRDRSYGRVDSVARAIKRLGEENYDLIFNNCEHFAHWCTRGEQRSPQGSESLFRFAGCVSVGCVAVVFGSWVESDVQPRDATPQ